MFVDNINRNLKRGRIVLILAGDGIREDAESLVDLVQDTAGARFTWALVEMPVFQLPDQLGFIVQPRLIARTVLIERGVILISDDRIAVTPHSDNEKLVRPKSITEEAFFESLSKAYAQVSAPLHTLIDEASKAGIRPVFKGSLNLRWTGPDGIDRGLGYVMKDGQVWFDPVDRNGADEREREIAGSYLSAVAELIGGKVRPFPRSGQRSIYVDNHAPRISKLLEVQDGWLAAMQTFTDQIRMLKSD